MTVPSSPQPVNRIDGGSAITLPNAIAALGDTGTVLVTDGLTLTAVAPVGSAAAPIGTVTITAADQKRAVIRVTEGSGPWVFTGAATSTSSLRLEGMLLQRHRHRPARPLPRRHDFLLHARPGHQRQPAHPTSRATAQASTTATLAPVTVWVEGEVSTFTVDRSITGPIRTRTGGLVETLRVNDSVVQGLAVRTAGHAHRAARRRRHAQRAEPQARRALHLARRRSSPTAAAAVAAHADHADVSAADAALVVADLQAVIDGPLIWTASRFADRPLRDSTAAAVLVPPADAAGLAALNRQLLRRGVPARAGRRCDRHRRAGSSS